MNPLGWRPSSFNIVRTDFFAGGDRRSRHELLGALQILREVPKLLDTIAAARSDSSIPLAMECPLRPKLRVGSRSQ
jgi:hypothetical protein